MAPWDVRVILKRRSYGENGETEMKKLSLLPLLASVVLAATAQATTTLTTSLGLAQNFVTCLTLNVSTKPVEVDSVTFIERDGKVHPPTNSTCTYPGPISPGLACQDNVDLGTSGAFVRCVIVTKGNSKSIRGTVLMFVAGAQSILEAR
jgi:hypothetical protein